MLRILKDKGLGRYPILAEVLSKEGLSNGPRVNEDRAYHCHCKTGYSRGYNLIPINLLISQRKRPAKSIAELLTELLI